MICTIIKIKQLTLIKRRLIIVQPQSKKGPWDNWIF